jgi:hypothetical protein
MNFPTHDTTAYRDGDGREWIFISYLYARRSTWVCLDDPSSNNIPAFNPEPEPVPWQPEARYLTPVKSLSSPPVLAVLLVVALVVVTIVLIRVFWKKKSTA